jgi:hypothetical protein
MSLSLWIVSPFVLRISEGWWRYPCLNYGELHSEQIPPPGSNDEKYLEVEKRTSEDIYSFLMEGATRLKVQRFGSGTDTRYHIIAA